MISNAGKQMVVDHLMEKLKHISVGTGQPPSEYTTILDNEVLRKEVTEPFIDEDTLVLEMYIDDQEANNMNLSNLAIVGDGSSELNTGELFAGGVIDRVKDKNQTLTISIEVSVVEV